MNNVMFDNPMLLYIFIPLALIVIIPFFITLKKKSFKWFNLLSLLSHLAICVLLSLSVANVKTQEIKTETTIYFLADVSCTTQNVQEEMDNYIKEFKGKMSSSSELGIVTFAKDAEELVKPGQPIESISNSKVDTGATNYQEALSYTASLFNEEHKKRIIILSDAKETDGDALAVKEQLIAQGIRIDAVYFDSSLKENEKEIQLDEIKGSSSTFLNDNDTLTLIVKSNYDAAVKVSVNDGNTSFYNATHVVKKGVNEIRIDANTSSVGTHTYLVNIDEKNDNIKENNSMYYIQEIHEKCEVLVISGTYENATSVASTISSNANVTTLMTYNSIPTDLQQYAKYDEIILSNTDLNTIKNKDTFVEILETLVTVYGKSLITLGGQNTYLDGGFISGNLKEMLPVDMNPSDTKRKTALILVIDNSGSMSGERLSMAIEGAKACLDILTPEDYIGVISFESYTRVVQPLASVGFKDSIIKRIDTIRTGDGTMMTPGLIEAYEEMQSIKNQMSNRQVILISDGMPSDSGQQDIVKMMADDGIVVSTIGIGAMYAGSLLSELATIGKGNYYAINGASQLPNVMLGEVSDIIMDSVIEGNIPVNIKLPNDPVMEGIKEIPNINGFNYSKAKYNATTVLSTTHTLENGDTINDVPIYTYWEYGKGKVATYMSDIDQKWTNDFFKQDSGKKFLKSIVKTNLPETHHDSYLFVDVKSKGETSQVDVIVPKIVSSVEVRVTVTDPLGNKEKKELTLLNGKYSQQFDTFEKGTYDVLVEYINKRNSNVMKYQTKFTYSYSKEYDKFMKPDNVLLYQLVQDSGMVSSNIEDIVNINQEDVIYNKYYYKQLLLAALIIFVIDIAIRKIRWKDIKNLFKKTVS